MADDASPWDGAGPVKMLLTFDPVPGRREEYFQYMLGHFIPALEHLGLTMAETWHTAYGDYPLRLTAFVAPNASAMNTVIGSDAFAQLEERLQDYVRNYSRRVVPADRRFQF
jgi:2-keto-4-pentenoate hydratase